jgi:hypothetical protein
MKRNDKILIFFDLLGFGNLTEQYPRRIVRSRKGHFRGSGTSESNNQLSTFHSVLEQTIYGFTRMAAHISAMAFSDCGFVCIGNPLMSAMFAVKLMQRFVRAGVPVRMGMAAGTFWPGRLSTDVFGETSFARTIFYGTAIVRAHQAEQCGLAGMRIFLDESLESAFSQFDYRHKVLRLERTRKGVIAELSYLYHADAYVQVPHPEPLDDDLALWRMCSRMRRVVDRNAPRRVRQQYVQTLSALNRMRRATGRPQFKRSDGD